MKHVKTLAAFSIASAALVVGCASQGPHSRSWDRNVDQASRNGQIDEHKGERPGKHVVIPPNGYPGGNMSTVEDDRTRVGFLPEKSYENVPVRNAEATPVKDSTVTQDSDIKNRSAAPEANPTPAPVVRHRHIARRQSHTASRRAVAKGTTHKRVHHDRTLVRSSGVAKPTVASSENSGAFVKMREVEALNRLHHVNQTEIALADLAISKSESATIKSTAQQTKADYEAKDERVKALADKLGIKLESYSPATYDVAVKNELNRTDAASFDTALTAVTERSHKDAAYDLTIARAEVKDAQIRGLIQNEMPSLQAHRVKTSSPRASESTENLGR